MAPLPNTHPFATLDPSFILHAIETNDYVCDGRIFPLNSYENRVYQVGIENNEPIIAKFYRPNRWTDEQIQEEHDFCYELIEAELPVVAPLRNAEGASIFSYGEFRFSLYPRRGGHAPELDNYDNLVVLGRFLGRIHLIGASREFRHRPTINSVSYGYESVQFISERFIPAELKQAYDTLTTDLLRSIDTIIAGVDETQYLRTLVVVIGGIVIYFTDWLLIDPLLSLVIILVIAYSAWGLLRDSFNLSVDAVPQNIDIEAIKEYLLSLPDVKEIHDLHVWAMSTTQVALTAHLLRESSTIDDNFLRLVANELKAKHGVHHATIQLENGHCDLQCQH